MILYHHGLELEELTASSEYENMADQRFLLSLPVHTMPPLMGNFSLEIINKLRKMKNQRCKYGTGKRTTGFDEEKNIKFLHSMHEAMKIDTYFAGNTQSIQQRVNYTCALLLGLFDVSHHRCYEVSLKKPESTLANYHQFAIKLSTALHDGEEWVQNNCEKSFLINTGSFKVDVWFFHNSSW